MKSPVKTTAKLFLSACLCATLPAWSAHSAPNLAAPDFRQAEEWLQEHRLSEDAFIRLSREPGTVVLDVSDGETYRLLHVAGARHLTWQELADADAVGKVLPDRETRILIYENNNYRTVRRRFETHQSMAAEFSEERRSSGENVAVCRALQRHGYRHIYELAPYVRIDRSQLPLVASMTAVELGQPVEFRLLAVPTPTVTFLP